MREGITLADMNSHVGGYLPDLLEVEIVTLEEGRLTSRMPVRQKHLSPNDSLHAAAIITLADTTCGWGTRAHLPNSATGFTTIELKSNFIKTARHGIIFCEAVAEHLGKTTQVWSATVTNENGQKLALFRCSQLVLYAGR